MNKIKFFLSSDKTFIVSGEDEFLDKLIMFDVKTGRVLTSNFQFWYVKNLENEQDKVFLKFRQDFYSFMDSAGEGVFANVEFTLDESENDFAKAIKVANIYFDKRDENYINSLGATPENWAKYIWDIVDRDGASEYFFFEAIDHLSDEQYQKLMKLYPKDFN